MKEYIDTPLEDGVVVQPISSHNYYGGFQIWHKFFDTSTFKRRKLIIFPPECRLELVISF
jgi:hypothetical protein